MIRKYQILYQTNEFFEKEKPTCCAAGSQAKSRCGLVARNGPSDPLAQYIRSGAEGARGMLDFGAWSLSHSHCSALNQLLVSLREDSVGSLYVSLN